MRIDENGKLGREHAQRNNGQRRTNYERNFELGRPRSRFKDRPNWSTPEDYTILPTNSCAAMHRYRLTRRRLIESSKLSKTALELWKQENTVSKAC